MRLKSAFRIKDIVVNDDSVVTGRVRRWYGIANEDTYVDVILFLDDTCIFRYEYRYSKRILAENAVNKLMEDAYKLSCVGVKINGKVVKLSSFENELLNSLEDEITTNECFGLLGRTYKTTKELTKGDIIVPKDSKCIVEYVDKGVYGSGLMLMYNDMVVAALGSSYCDDNFILCE